MAYWIGRAIQLIGMTQLAYALYIGFERGDSKAELWHLGLGATLFLVGRFVERRFARA